MKYLLTVLTNGRAECLERTLTAFEKHVHPRPSKIFIHIDGPYSPPRFLYDEMPWAVSQAVRPVGFTYGTKDCYDYAAQSEYEWCFHMEDDMVIVRPTDLTHLRDVMELEQHVCQMALIRSPWGHEIPYGGYVAQHEDQYKRRETEYDWKYTSQGEIGDPLTAKWLEHVRNWTTNPALQRTQFLKDHPYPEVDHSEGIYGFEIRDRAPGTTFGLWGWGEPWCAHIGVDRQRGSHGY